MKLKKLLLTTIAASILLTASAAAFGQDERLIGGQGITVFRDRDFRGSTATYRSNVSNLARTQFNDQISSVRIGPGEQWELCEHANYGGQCIVVSGEESDLRKNSWDNRISSFRRLTGSGGGGSYGYIVLFDQQNYRGSPTNYSGPTPDLGGMNRRAQSVTIGSGTWELCERINYQGRCITLSTSTSNLNNQGMGNRIASVRPAGFNPPPPPTPNPYIVVFTQNNYRGTPTNYNREMSSISKTAGSITIGNGIWEVCTGSNFTGQCETLSSSVSNLRSLNITRIRSVRPMRPQPR